MKAAQWPAQHRQRASPARQAHTHHQQRLDACLVNSEKPQQKPDQYSAIFALLVIRIKMPLSVSCAQKARSWECRSRINNARSVQWEHSNKTARIVALAAQGAMPAKVRVEVVFLVRLAFSVTVRSSCNCAHECDVCNLNLVCRSIHAQGMSIASLLADGEQHLFSLSARSIQDL